MLSFSLKLESIVMGKVCPFSQISTSFLILSYISKKKSKLKFKGTWNEGTRVDACANIKITALATTEVKSVKLTF